VKWIEIEGCRSEILDVLLRIAALEEQSIQQRRDILALEREVCSLRPTVEDRPAPAAMFHHNDHPLLHRRFDPLRWHFSALKQIECLFCFWQ
jgi:hypothetical protein